MNEETALNLHVEMWNEMAENGYTRKDQTALVKKYKPAADCFLCEAYLYKDKNCKRCPFAAFSEDEHIEEDDRPCGEWGASPYVEFIILKESSDKLLKEICIEIADLIL